MRLYLTAVQFRTCRLFGSHSHLSSLASESSHSLLSPLGSHAAVDVDEQLEERAVSNVNEGLEGHGLVGEAEAIAGDEVGVLDSGAELLHGGSLDRDDGRRGSDKDLHLI